MHHHTLIWRELDAKNPSKNWGTEVAGTWYWYQSWLDRVREYCTQHKNEYV